LNSCEIVWFPQINRKIKTHQKVVRGVISKVLNRPRTNAIDRKSKKKITFTTLWPSNNYICNWETFKTELFLMLISWKKIWALVSSMSSHDVGELMSALAIRKWVVLWGRGGGEKIFTEKWVKNIIILSFLIPSLLLREFTSILFLLNHRFYGLAK
jgi:hypothetical protein